MTSLKIWEKVKNWFSIDRIFQFLGLCLFGVYLAQLYVDYAIDNRQVLNGLATLLMFILRWSTIVAVGFAVVVSFFKGRTFRFYAGTFGIVVGILNLVFYKENMIAWGTEAYTQWRSILFNIEQILLIIIGVYQLVLFIKNKDIKKLNIVRCILVLIGMFLAFFYQPMLKILFGTWGKVLTGKKGEIEAVLDFNGIHIFSLLFNLIFIIAGYLLMDKKTMAEKRLFFASLACSGVFNFFYPAYTGLAALPFHLCNLAIIIMFIAFVFNIKGIFYFTYFVNVIGAIFAMLMPNITHDAFALRSVHFWYNHIYACVLPILGVAIKVYPRPTLKLMGGAIGWFTAYFVLVAVMNAWFSNYGPVDYFFINSNFFFEKLSMKTTLKDNYVWSIQYKDLIFDFYPLFYLVVYVSFVGLMFVMWFIYDSLFHVADAHYALRMKKKLLRGQYIDLRKELNGRSLQEPIYLEGDNMIEIKNFTKRYSGANKPSVENFSLTVEGGEVFGFLGHNGAGKSTTIKAIVGIHSITDGKIYVDGYDVAKQPVEAKLRIGYVSDNHAVYEKLTGREYINYIADLYMVPQKERDERLEKYAAMFKLTHALNRQIKSYSHGMKQKIVVIASLIHDPKVWILDEPLTGLDPTSSYQIKECMKEHAARGNIVFFSSHVIEVVEKVCTKICIINGGKLQCIYSLKELKEKGISLEELYLKYVTNGEKFRDVQEA